MSEYTEGFYQSEETKALNWMNSLIKNYSKKREYISVYGSTIFWIEGECNHSICVKDGKFVIDGKEFFINSKLWEKYTQLCEVTGAWRIKMPKKIAFPDDWSDLSDEQVLENIQYLEKNYKKCNILVDADKNVTIDNVKISRSVRKIDNREKTCFIINNKVYCRESSIGKELIDLVHLCKMYKLPLKTKAKNWWNDNKDLLEISALITGLFVVVGGLVFQLDKNEKKSKEQLKQEIIKEALDSLRKEQQKTIMYNDSINQKIR